MPACDFDYPKKHGLGNRLATVGHGFPMFLFRDDFTKEFRASLTIGVLGRVAKSMRV